MLAMRRALFRSRACSALSAQYSARVADWTIMPPMLSSGALTLCFILGVVGMLLALVSTIRRKHIPKGLRLPPGPRGKFIIGNASDMPTHYEWETYTQWAKKYGNLVYMNIFGQSMVCVNSIEVARDLFEKRSTLYSDRFDAPMLHDLIGFGWSFGRMRYGQYWRRHRRAFHQYFCPDAVSLYHDIQIKHTQGLLRRLHESPESFIKHLRHLAGAIIMEVAYGIKVLPKDDPYIAIAETAISAIGAAGNPGAFLVDSLPILKYVPEWMPGAGFQRKAREWRVPISQMRVLPFMATKKALRTGTAAISVTASLLEELYNKTDSPVDEEEVICNAVGAAYAAGSATTASALTSFILAMVLYPQTQRKAQAEIDGVIGNDRLPTFDDRNDLPYVNALCKEVVRWHPVTPLGVAHMVTDDDIYGDYFIPGGSIVFGNVWAMLHDEKVYGPRTSEFIPERFLESEVPDPTAAFGFGRRICPGRYLAENSIFIAITSILKMFDLSPPKDNNGNEISVQVSFTSGFLSQPEPFRCEIKLRSPHAEALIVGRGDD